MVIQIDDRGVAAVKQQGFGPEVFFHGAVEIQMILGQVGKSGSLEMQAQHPMKGQAVRRHFHGGAGHAGVGHFPQDAVQLQGFGGGAGRFPGNLTEKHAIGTD